MPPPLGSCHCFSTSVFLFLVFFFSFLFLSFPVLVELSNVALRGDSNAGHGNACLCVLPLYHINSLASAVVYATDAREPHISWTYQVDVS